MIDEKNNNKLWLRILLGLFFLLAFVVLLQNSFGYLDPDFGWHMKTGELIWQTHAVPDINYSDYTLAGTHWVDHEWLANLFVYLVYHNFGYLALSIFFALLILAALIIQLWFTRKHFLHNYRGLIIVLVLQAFGLYASLPHLGVRVQEATVLCLLLLNIIVFLYNKNKNYKTLFWLLPLFVFWASAHAGFLIGLFILGLFIVVKAVELWSVKKFPQQFIAYEKVLTLKQIFVFAGFSFLSFLITLATPYGWRLYGFLLGYQSNYYQTHLSEWQGQYFFPFVYPQLGYIEVAMIFLVLSLFAGFIFKRIFRRKIDLYNFILLAIFTCLAIKARRHFPLLFIVSLPIIAEFFIGFFMQKPEVMKLDGKEMSKTKKRNSVWRNLLIVFFSLILLFLSVVIALRINFTNQPEKAYQDKFPYQAAIFLRSHPEWHNLNLFNEYAWGGYLIWQDPERKLFIDGRLPQYPLAGRTALEEYDDFFNQDKMLSQLQKYNIGLVLISPKEEYPKINWWDEYFFAINKKNIFSGVKEGFYFLEYLKSSPDWRSVYKDSTAEIFIKE